MTRRDLLKASAIAAAPAVLQSAPTASVNFVFGTYGMKDLGAVEALKQTAAIGYDGVELCVMPEWATDPARLSASGRAEIRKVLQGEHLAIPAVLEALPLVGTPQKRAYNLERIKRIAELAHDIAPSHPPLLDTILGLKTSEWEAQRPHMADELREWARVAKEGGIVIGIKPHAAHAINNASRTQQLLADVASPHIRVIYDYSHFYVEGFQLEESFHQLLREIAFVSVKDSSGKPENHVYLLPGDGKTDYREYFRMLVKYGYRGGVGVEVSAMIHRKPGYQSIPTAKLCYERLAPAFADAGLKRTREPVGI